MKVGVLPPFHESVITDPDAVAAFLCALEEGGAESVWTVEHVLVAEDYEPRYSYSPTGRMPGAPGTVMPDPIEWLTFAAALTTNLRLGTSVVVAPLHSPVVLAKRVATLDQLSRGRVILGLGSGWQIEEYTAVGVPYEERGRRLDDTIAALRVLWRDDPATFESSWVRFSRVHSDPKPLQPGGVPIVIGGSTDRAARRAGRVGDGWFPYVVSPDDVAARLVTLRAAARDAGRDPGAIEITVWPGSWRRGGSLDAELARRYADLGVTRLVISAQEAEGPTLDDFRRFLDHYQRHVVSRL